MSPREEVIDIAKRRIAALISRDLHALEKLLSADFIYTNAMGKVFRKTDYLRTYVLNPEIVWKSQVLEVDHVHILGDTAILVGMVHDRAMFHGNALDAKFRTTQVYVRNDAGWIYLAGHSSSLTSEI